MKVVNPSINILITGTGSLIGQAIIKCIQCSHYHQSSTLIGCDYFENTIGSNWVSTNFLLPDAFKSPILLNSWLETIIHKVKQHNINYVFIGVDFELEWFAIYKDHIESQAKVKIIVNPLEVIQIGNDKFRTYSFLKQNGFSYPETSLLSVESSTKQHTYPIIVKPAIGARSRGVHQVANRGDLHKLANEHPEGYIVQELVGNDKEEYTCGVVRFSDGTLQSIVLNRSLKEGNTHMASHKKDDVSELISAYVESIATSLNVQGACNFQLRLTSNGEPKLFEINPRHSGTTYMRALFGFNEIKLLLDFHEGLPVKDSILTEGTAMRSFHEKLI